MSHTPTPWEVYQQMYYFQICPEDNKLFTIATCPSETWGGFDGPRARANAAHIVRCVNAHDTLMAALQDAYDDLNFDGTYTAKELLKTIEEVRSNITKALAAAEKGA